MGTAISGRCFMTIGLIAVLLVMTAFSASNLVVADVDPPQVNATLNPGESVRVDKSVETPPIPPVLDFCLLVDNSGSYVDDLPNIKGLAPEIFDGIQSQVSDLQACLGTFVDFPIDPYGNAAFGDYAYQLDQDLTPDKTTWTTAVDNMVTLDGADEPESQYAALHQIATGTGIDVIGNCPGFGAANVPAGQNANWRPGATHVVAITTDASFHNPGDPSPNCPDGGYPGPSQADTITELGQQNIKVIAIKAPGSTTQMDDIAAATGGSVVTTGDTSEEIADAILAGLEEIKTDVWHEVTCDPGLNVTLDPPVHLDVSGGTTVNFTETIAVDDDPSLHGQTLECVVTFIANTFPHEGSPIGRQSVTVEVPSIEVSVDVRPTSCPNPLQRSSQGVLPVAILGTADFDVADIDASTVRLEGVSPQSWELEDVATPFANGLSDPPDRRDCTTEGPDGFTDLTVKFDTQEVVAALGAVNVGDVVVVHLTGNLFNGAAIEGVDVVWIR